MFLWLIPVIARIKALILDKQDTEGAFDTDHTQAIKSSRLLNRQLNAGRRRDEQTHPSIALHRVITVCTNI